MPRPGHYRIAFGTEGCAQQVMDEGRDFHIQENAVFDGLTCALPQRERDLLRIAAGVYVADRMLRRFGRARAIRLQVEVAEPAFWADGSLIELVQDALGALSDDVWDVTVKPGRAAPSPSILPFPQDRRRVCLYSGGLDSAAGLASSLPRSSIPMLAVAAAHQPGQKKRIATQCNLLVQHHRVPVVPILPRVAMINPPRMSKQELSQRCRAFMFFVLGGLVASRVHADQVEIYENGIGILNLPLMTGMLLGSRSTRGAHPAFARAMSALLSRLVDRSLEFVFPFRGQTKGELVRGLRLAGLPELARSTVSCAHYPVRLDARHQQCGWCPACITRRQSMIEAGIDEPIGTYQYDLFSGADGVRVVPQEKLAVIKAHLMQLAKLRELQDDGRKPSILWRHLTWSRFLSPQEPVLPWVDLLRRYREEWLRLVRLGQREQWLWADWYPRDAA
jgi:hypothetical protein